VLIVLACVLAPPASAHMTSTSYLFVEVPQDSAPVNLRCDLAVHDIVW